jgi:hypothetical protein
MQQKFLSFFNFSQISNIILSFLRISRFFDEIRYHPNFLLFLLNIHNKKKKQNRGIYPILLISLTCFIFWCFIYVNSGLIKHPLNVNTIA